MNPLTIPTRLLSLSTNLASAYALPPLTALARTAIVALMQRIEIGRLRVVTEEGVWSFPPEGVETGEGEGGKYKGLRGEIK